MVVEIDLDEYVIDVNRLGHKLIKSAEIEIGGQKIDKHYGEWLDIWAQLSEVNLSSNLNEMVSGKLKNSSGPSKLYVPLQFWFNRNPGLALPLIALQYHEVKVVIEFAKEVPGSSGKMNNVCLYCDYIFLDTDERRRFAQVSHEYLIEQLQTTGNCGFKSKTTKATVSLNFNHPCKELVWVVQNDCKKNTFDFTVTGEGNKVAGVETEMEHVNSAVLKLNGHDRFRKRDGSYFRLVQPYQHHGGAPNQGFINSMATSADANADAEHGYIYCYSFALKPLEHQPSGTCNFSRIDNAVLDLELANTSAVTVLEGTTERVENFGSRNVRVYATNYNVLRIMSGMGGLAYSN